MCEALIADGICIVAAAGNDENQLEGKYKPYHSSYGKTVDNLIKPELLAYGIWMGAPVLPCTKEQPESVTLYGPVNSPDNRLINQLQKNIHYINSTGLFTRCTG